MFKKLKQILSKNKIVKNVYYKLFKPLPKFPPVIAIEPTNCCNYACSMCPNKDMKAKRGFMSFELYEKIVSECERYKEDIQVFSFTGRGESLLHPGLIRMLVHAKQRNFKEIRFSTNASLLNENFSDEILNIGIDKLIISLNAATEKAYNLVCSDDFKKTEFNVKYLLERKKKINSPKPYVVARITKMPEVIDEIDLFAKKWGHLVDQIMVVEFYNWCGYIKKDKLNFRPHTTPCFYLWREMRVTWDGKVPLCCWDYESAITLGDVKDSTIFNIWNSKKYNNIRKMHIEGHLPFLCQSCGFYEI